MPKKVLDISQINDEKSDLTFFNIDREEENETLKALKQTYVTTNYKEETILNLQTHLKYSSKETSKELKLESYKKYNEALDLANKNYITGASKLIEEAVELNPKDVDILNLKGLITLLKCDFSKAFESFYTGLCYENNFLSRKYVDLLSSEEYNSFLARYNHSIRFINEELNHESIQILENITADHEDLIEPYVILSLLYKKLENDRKQNIYLDKLKLIDKDNILFEEKEKVKNEPKKEIPKKKSNKNFLKYAFIISLVIGIGLFFMEYKNKLDTLTLKLSQNEKLIDEKGKELEETNKELEQASEKLEQMNKELEETNKKLEENDNAQNVTTNEVKSDEEKLYNNAVKLKNVENYEGAISYFEKVLSEGKTKKYKEESLYQIAKLNETLKNTDEAITYYRKYINTYTPSDKYYDESYYNLGMLYYNSGQLQKAKDTFYDMRSEVPNSEYNNSKVSSILKES